MHLQLPPLWTYLPLNKIGTDRQYTRPFPRGAYNLQAPPQGKGSDYYSNNYQEFIVYENLANISHVFIYRYVSAREIIWRWIITQEVCTDQYLYHWWYTRECYVTAVGQWCDKLAGHKVAGHISPVDSPCWLLLGSIKLHGILFNAVLYVSFVKINFWFSCSTLWSMAYV